MSYFQGTSSLLEYLVSSLPLRYFRRTSSSWFFRMFSFLTIYWFRRLFIVFLYLLLLLMFCLASCLLPLISLLSSSNWALNLAFSSFSYLSIQSRNAKTSADSGCGKLQKKQIVVLIYLIGTFNPSYYLSIQNLYTNNNLLMFLL